MVDKKTYVSTAIIMLMMVSTVSAVPYTQQQPAIQELTMAQQHLEELMNSEQFQQIENIVNEYFPHQYDQMVRDQLITALSPYGELPTSDPFYMILVIIAEAIMLLLGHNLIGQTSALLVDALVAIPLAIGLGAILSITLDMALIASIAEIIADTIIWDDVVVQYGLIGAIALGIAVILFIIVFIIAGVAVNLIIGIGTVYLTYIQAITDYIYSTKTTTAQDYPTIQEQSMMMKAFQPII